MTIDLAPITIGCQCILRPLSTTPTSQSFHYLLCIGAQLDSVLFWPATSPIWGQVDPPKRSQTTAIHPIPPNRHSACLYTSFFAALCVARARRRKKNLKSNVCAAGVLVNGVHDPKNKNFLVVVCSVQMNGWREASRTVTRLDPIAMAPN